MTGEIKRYWQNYIAGERIDGGDGGCIAVENPATLEPLAEIAEATETDIDAAVAAARGCVETRVLIDMKPAKRLQMMLRVAAEIRAVAEEMVTTLCLDSGKRIVDARGEVETAARYFEYYGGLADKIEGRSIPLGGGYVNYTLATPYGVSGQIVPWNFPLGIAARSLSVALATGNASVVKSPELAPLANCLLAEACERAGVPAGAANILCGYGTRAGAALAEHPDVNQLVFTGSIKTGQSIMLAAAERVVPTVMELGGKGAGVVYPDAVIERVIASARNGIFRHGGQVCSAMSRLLVHESRHDEIVNGIVEMAQKLPIGPGIDDSDITPLMSANQLDRVENYCLGAVQQGAEAVIGGRRLDDAVGHFMPPTIFTGIKPDMTIAQEEVFGPVLSVLRFREPEEAMSSANGTEYGLTAGVFTTDLDRALWSAERLHAGQIFINEWHAGGIETPFGGMKKSGFGREKGQEALLNYVQTKNVAIRIGLE